MDKLLTAADVAARLQVRRETIYRWAQRGLLPHVRLSESRALRFLPDDVDVFIAARRVGQ